MDCEAPKPITDSILVKPLKWGLALVIYAIVALCIGIPLLCYTFKLMPTFKRGFFCDDQSIMLPYKDDTVTVLVLGITIAIGGLIVFPMTESLRYYTFVKAKTAQGDACVRSNNTLQEAYCLHTRSEIWIVNSKLRMHPVVVNILSISGFYFLGCIFHLLISEMCKNLVGRLRPHFFSVCKPQWTNMSLCNPGVYIDVYKCTNQDATAAQLHNMILSFPSGHAATAVYGFLFLIIYLERRFRTPIGSLARVALQTICLCWGLFVCLTRVSDHKHHWSDVLVGGFLGGAIAVFILNQYNTLWKDKSLSQLILPSKRNLNNMRAPVDIITEPPVDDTNDNAYRPNDRSHLMKKVQHTEIEML